MMEQKRLEMQEAIDSNTLHEWLELDNLKKAEQVDNYITTNEENHNVWYYYYLNGQAPDLDNGKYVFENQRPPLKQFKYLTVDKISCNRDLVLIVKYDGSPACVKPATKTKLIERGWGTITYLDKIMEVQETDHSVKYRIDGNATVTDSIYSKDRQSVIITLDAITSGSLTVELPRTLIDSGHSNCDPNCEREEPFAVLINHEEVLFEEIATTSEKRTLSISFQENTKKIEIISFCLI
ncbi:MAG: hypothetical protein WD512_08420 [Candidatus Paceibacterota bacterium]